jgi:uncharacterized protein (TIGR00725 family)
MIMNISIFGGSSPIPGSPSYLQAYFLGEKLAKAGHSVLTGGYIGAMEAVSRGASEAGGIVIGVTCSEIEKWRPVKANAWVGEERSFLTLQDRLHELICNCDAAMALPGGAGTLTEIALAWNLMAIKAMPAKLLILIGYEWHSILELMFTSLSEYIPTSQRSLLHFAKDVNAACSILGDG